MNNNAAIGYMIIAARRSGVSEERIKRIEKWIVSAMDEWTEEEAEKVYKSF